MMGWILAAIFFVLLVAVSVLLLRATTRLLQFDEVLGAIVSPMENYAEKLRKIGKAEGLLHDHPEVVAFHRANMEMLAALEGAIVAVKEGQPPQIEPPKGNPPEYE
jgi:hypothetical protein